MARKRPTREFMRPQTGKGSFKESTSTNKRRGYTELPLFPDDVGGRFFRAHSRESLPIAVSGGEYPARWWQITADAEIRSSETEV